MTPLLPFRPKSRGTFAAVVLFLTAYAGALAIILAPERVVPVDTGAVFADGQ